MILFPNQSTTGQGFNPIQSRDKNNAEGKCAFSEAVQAFRTTMLTGRRPLSDEEKAEIENLIDDFLLQHNIDTPEGKKAFEVFLNSLALEFGSRSDFADFVKDLIYEMTGLEMELNDTFIPRGDEIKIKPSNKPDEDDEEAIVSFMQAKIGTNFDLKQQLRVFPIG